MKKISILICTLFLISCNSNKSKDAQKAQYEVKNEPNTTQEKTNKNTPYIIVKVSDRDAERLDKTDDFSPAVLKTTRLNGSLITTFNAFLGSFEDEHFYRLSLSFTRESENTFLEQGDYKITSILDKPKLKPKSDVIFESTNTLNSDRYNTIKALGTLEDYPDDFYAPLDDKNILVIESTEDLGETENSTNTISVHFQRVKGYLIFNIIKIQTGKEYLIRVDFDIINEIRIPINN